MKFQTITHHFLTTLVVLFLILVSSGCSNSSVDKEGDEAAFYPVDFCVVTGNDFDEDSGMIPYTHIHEGITIKFCCKPCLPKFQKNPEKYLVILEEEMDALKNESKNEG